MSFGVLTENDRAGNALLALGALLSVACVGLLPATASAVVPAERVPPQTDPDLTVRSSVPPAGAVFIADTANAKKLVKDAPAGTSFVLASGIHSLFSVIPQSGDLFYAQPGAVLDGAHRAITAFKPPHGEAVNDVAVIGASRSQPLVIENYGVSTHSQTATVQTYSQSPAPGVPSSGWWLQWVEVVGSASRGISVSDDAVVLECTVVGNERLGIGGSGVGVTIERSDISRNGLEVAHRGWEAGGIKTTGRDILIADNQIDENGAPGIWTDGGADTVLALSNHLSGNRYGVRVEISSHVTIAENTIRDTQQQSVLVIASSNVDVRANAIDGNFGGIIVGGVGRYSKTGIHLDDVYVDQNRVVDSGATGLHQTPPPGTVIKFDYDHFVGGHLQWDGHRATLALLQSLGQERHGTWAAK